MTMCTKENVQEIVHAEIHKVLGVFITKFWYIITGMIIASAAAWYSLYYQVQSIEREAANMDIGVQRQLETLRQDYIRDMQEIKSDIRFIRDRLQ